MSWSAPMTAVAGSIFTAAQFNTFIRDNLLECPAAKATDPGSYFAVTGTNQLIERGGKALAITGSSATTTSTSYTETLEVSGGGSSQGPSLTLTTGPYALLGISASVENNSTSSARMAYEVTGASSISPADNRGIGAYGSASVGGVYGNIIYHDNLTPGVNVFTAQYRVAGGTGTFASRRLQVVPF
jgi:hypothetical protein